MFEAIKIIDYNESTFAILTDYDDFKKIYFQRIGKEACQQGEILLDAKPTPIEKCNDPAFSKLVIETVGDLSD